MEPRLDRVEALRRAFVAGDGIARDVLARTA
jgi:hypothetical protein